MLVKIPGIDSINTTLFYGGPFVAQVVDLVHQRKAPINPSYFKNYDYEYLGRTLYNGESVYKFAYRKIKDTSKIRRSGLFYIDIASLAYVYFDCRTEGSWYQGSPNISKVEKSGAIMLMYMQERNRKVYWLILGLKPTSGHACNW